MSEMEVLPPDGGYPLLDNFNEVLSLIDENLGKRGFSILSLPRIRVPSGGGLNFRVDTAAGEELPRRIEGLITSWRSARLYWKSRMVQGKPPDCTSTDGWKGVGDPGGNCQAPCPFSLFGSSINMDGSRGSGQACKDIRQVLFLMPGEILPHLLSIPPTSVKGFDNYTLTLLSARAAYWSATTVMTLEKVRNDSGIEYSRILFRLGRRLQPNEKEIFKPYHLRMKDILIPAIVDATAYEVDDQPHGLVSGPRDRDVPPPPDNSDIPF